jgi:hypothetical protein
MKNQVVYESYYAQKNFIIVKNYLDLKYRNKDISEDL